MELNRRFGQFLVLLGMMFLLLFWLSQKSQTPVYSLGLGGGVAFGLGMWLLWRYRPSVQPVERFTTLKKILKPRPKKPKRPRKKK